MRAVTNAKRRKVPRIEPPITPHLDPPMERLHKMVLAFGMAAS